MFMWNNLFVINNSLVGVINQADKCDFITGVYGMRWGIEGFMAGNIIDFGAKNHDSLKQLDARNNNSLNLSEKRYNYPLVIVNAFDKAAIIAKYSA